MKKIRLIGSALALIMLLQFIAGIGLASQPSCCELTLYQYYGNEDPLVAYNGIPLEVHALENGTIINQTMQIESVNFGNLKRECSENGPHFAYDFYYDIAHPVWNETDIAWSFKVPDDCYLKGFGFQLNSTNSAGRLDIFIWKSEYDEQTQSIIPKMDEEYDFLFGESVFNSNLYNNISCNVFLDYESTYGGIFFISIGERSGRNAAMNVKYDDGLDSSLMYDIFYYEEEIIEGVLYILRDEYRLSMLDQQSIDPRFYVNISTQSGSYAASSIDNLEILVNNTQLPSSGYYSKSDPFVYQGSSINYEFESWWENFSVDISDLLVNYSKTYTMETEEIKSLGAVIGFDYSYTLTIDPLLYGEQLLFSFPKTVTNPLVTRDGGSIPITYRETSESHLISVFHSYARGGFYKIHVDYPSGIASMQMTQTMIVIGIIAGCGAAAGSTIFIVKRKQTEKLLQRYG